MAPQSLSELVSLIADNTTKIQEYLTTNNLPSPSFDVDGPSEIPIAPDAKDIHAARSAVIDAAQHLRDLLLGPRQYIQSYSHNELLSMQAIIRFKIASSFPTHEEASFAQIADACSLSERDLRRFLRHAMTQRIFREPRKGWVAHTAASRLLAEETQVHDWVGASTDELWQAAAQTVNAMVMFPGSQEPFETGFSLANNTEKSIYEELSDHPERARRFGSALASFTNLPGYDHRFVVEGYDWESLGSGTVVDIGGSHGYVSICLAQHFPSLKFVVQDLPPVVAEGLAKMPHALSGRVTFMAHDFLTEQPVKNADVYLFRWIFHNWSDKYCIQMLRSLIPALKVGAHVLINDNCLPEPGELPLWMEKSVRSMDLTMLEIQNSRERELDEWAELFRRADPRFRFLGGKQPAGSILWFMDTVWDDSDASI